MAGRQSSSAASHHPWPCQPPSLPLPAHGASASLACCHPPAPSPAPCCTLGVHGAGGACRAAGIPPALSCHPLLNTTQSRSAFPVGSFISAYVVFAPWGRPGASSLWGRKGLGAVSGVCRGRMASLLQCYCGQGAGAEPSSPPRARLQDSCSSPLPWPRCHRRAGAGPGWGWSAAACA